MLRRHYHFNSSGAHLLLIHPGTAAEAHPSKITISRRPRFAARTPTIRSQPDRAFHRTPGRMHTGPIMPETAWSHAGGNTPGLFEGHAA